MNDIRQSVSTFRILKEKLLEEMPELANDPECLLDTIDGLTDTTEQITTLVRSAVEDENLVEELEIYMSRLRDRKSWLEHRAKKKRAIALHAMQEIDVKHITAPDMNIGVRFVPPAVVIVNEDLIPFSFLRIRKEPDKALIKDELKHGRTVPGATLGNGNFTLSVKI